jgi:predicted dehydrogenase
MAWCARQRPPHTLERYDAHPRLACSSTSSRSAAASYRLALDHFCDVARHGEEPFITAEDGRRAQIIAEAALRSAREGGPVAISY